MIRDPFAPGMPLARWLPEIKSETGDGCNYCHASGLLFRLGEQFLCRPHWCVFTFDLMQAPPCTVN